MKRGMPAVWCSSKRHFEVLPHYEAFYDFFNRNKVFWMLPCDTPDGGFYGFVLRGFHKKDYLKFVTRGDLELLYGFHDFGTFEKGDPIILTEGAKDREVLAKHHPYTLALLTSNLNIEQSNFLSGLTSRFVICLDNDDTGNEMYEKIVRKLSKRKASCRRLQPRLPDFGKYVRSDRQQELLGKELKSILGK